MRQMIPSLTIPELAKWFTQAIQIRTLYMQNKQVVL